MLDKAQGWIDRASEGKLHRRMAWFSIECQFWPKVSYGLCCNLAPLPQLQYMLKNSTEQWYPWVGLQRLRRRRLVLQLQVSMDWDYNTQEWKLWWRSATNCWCITGETLVLGVNFRFRLNYFHLKLARPFNPYYCNLIGMLTGQRTAGSRHFGKRQAPSFSRF